MALLTAPTAMALMTMAPTTMTVDNGFYLTMAPMMSPKIMLTLITMPVTMLALTTTMPLTMTMTPTIKMAPMIMAPKTMALHQWYDLFIDFACYLGSFSLLCWLKNIENMLLPQVKTREAPKKSKNAKPQWDARIFQGWNRYSRVPYRNYTTTIVKKGTSPMA